MGARGTIAGLALSAGAVAAALAGYHVLVRTAPTATQGETLAADLAAIRADLDRLATRLAAMPPPEPLDETLRRRVSDLEARLEALARGGAGGGNGGDVPPPRAGPDGASAAGGDAPPWTEAEIAALTSLLDAVEARRLAAAETEAMKGLLGKYAAGLTPAQAEAALGPMLEFRSAFRNLYAGLEPGSPREDHLAVIERMKGLRAKLVADLSERVPPETAATIGEMMPPRPLSTNVTPPPAMGGGGR